MINIQTNKSLMGLVRKLSNDSTFGDKATIDFMDRGNFLETHKGRRWTIAHYKAIRLAFTRGMSNQPLKTLPGVSLTAHGLPMGISPKVRSRLLERDPNDLRIILTILTLGRTIHLPVKVDVSAITRPWEGYITYELDRGIKSCRGLRHLEDFPMGNTIAFKSNKGPSGGALTIALPQLGSIPDSLIESLLTLGGPRFERYTKAMKTDYSEELRPNIRIRKLHHLIDKEGKTRTIAILDGGSQTVLKPFHDDLIKVIRKQPGDCTYNNIDVMDYLSKATGKYYSFDLTSATDRFPVEFQRRVGEARYGKGVANAWKDIMVNYDYEDTNGSYRYSAGQPMGAYTSGVTFSLSHHLILQYVCSKNKNSRYVVLGDDVVIRGDGAAKMYTDIIHTLKVDISEVKSHVSDDTFEFAKRGYTSGVEVTPIPLNSFIAASTRVVDLTMTIEECKKRLANEDIFARTGSISEYFMFVYGIRSKHSRNLERSIRRLQSFNIWISDPYEKTECLKVLWNGNDTEWAQGATPVNISKLISISSHTYNGDAFDDINNSIRNYWTLRGDQALGQKGLYLHPIARAIQDTSNLVYEACTEVQKCMNKVLELDEIDQLIAKEQIPELISTVINITVPTIDDLNKRSQAMVIRNTTKFMRIVEDHIIHDDLELTFVNGCEDLEIEYSKFVRESQGSR